MDWNGDGKHDWQDDAFFHNVIDNDSNSSNTPSSRGNYGSSSGGASFHLNDLIKTAQSIKEAFRKCHTFFQTNDEEDIEILRTRFQNWRKQK